MDTELGISFLKGAVCGALASGLSLAAGFGPAMWLIGFLVLVLVSLAASIDYKLMHVRHEIYLVKFELQKLNDPQLKAITAEAENLIRQPSRSSSARHASRGAER